MKIMEEEDPPGVFGLLLDCPKCGYCSWSEGSPEVTRFHNRERLWRRLLVGLAVVAIAIGTVVSCQLDRQATIQDHKDEKELLDAHQNRNRDVDHPHSER